MGVNDCFDYEFDGDVESQADEIIHEAKDKLVDLIYENVKSEIEQDRQNYVRAKKRADELQKECYEKREILDRLKTDLNNNGYKVNISGPFYGLDVYWEIRVSWEERGMIK